MIAEPMTTATDYALALCGAGQALSLARLARRARRSSTGAWAGAFLCTASGALFGGTWHGLAPHLGEGTRLALWLATYVAIGAANVLFLAGVSLAAIELRYRNWLVAAAVLKFGVLVGFIIAAQRLWYVACDVAVTLAVVALFASRSPRLAVGCGRLILGGVAVTVAGGLVQRMSLAPHPAFNHNDLFHAMQIGGLYLLYRGGLLLRDYGKSAPRG